MSGLKPKEKGTLVFTKRAVLSSLKYAQYKDVLSAVLDEGKTYSAAEIEKTINDFMKTKG